MNKSNKHLLYAIGILVVVVAVFAISKNSGLKGFAVGDISRTKYIEKPTFAFLQCDPAGSISIPRTFGAQQININCQSDTFGKLLGVNNGCTVTLTAPNKGALIKRDYSYKVYRGGILSEQQTISGGIGGYSGEQVSIPLNKDDYIITAYGRASTFFVFDELLNEGQSYIVQGETYGIKIYDFNSPKNGQLLDNTRIGNCVLEEEYYKGRQIQYKSPEIKELLGMDTKLDFRNLNKPGGVYTYFAGFIPVPTFDQKVEIFNGVEAYCMNNQLYKTLPITVNNFEYRIVNYEEGGFIQSVVCCNGDEKPGYVCQNHKWVTQTTAKCDLSKGIFCPQSQWQPYGEIQYRRFVCIENQCAPETIAVKCNDMLDCGSGKVCVTQSNPKDNYCAESGAGIGIIPPQGPIFQPICSSCFGWLRNKITGKYCTPQPAKKVLGFIPVPLTSQNKVCPIFLLILLGLLIIGGIWGYSVYKKKGGKRKRR